MSENGRSSYYPKTLPILALAALMFLVAEGRVPAQSSTGSIRGTVRDATGGVVPGATVRITDLGTSATTSLTTGAEGEFVAPALRPVFYDVTAESPGFKSTTVKGVKVDTAKDTRVDITLQVGELNQTVSVTSESPLLQTTGGAVAQTVEQKVIVDLPLNGRNSLELAFTLPGVTGNAGSELTGVFASDVAPGREMSINGARVGSTQFFADGASVTSVALARTTVSFSPDTIQEFTVQQSNYSAQYSQAGGAIIQQTTKSGTNDLHGTLYWFHRQKALTANPFDATRLQLFDNDARPPLRRQQLGATVGGPVWLPGLYQGKNRTFFFFAYEPTRQLESLITYSAIRVPTELEKKGDFSQSLVYFTNGTTQPYALLYQQFSKAADGALVLRPNPSYNPGLAAGASNPMWQYNNYPLFNPNDPDPNRRGRVLVDASGRSFVSPVVAKLVNELYPAPNLPMITSGSDAGANFAYFRKAENTDDRYTIRIDHRLNDAHTIYGRYTWQPLYGDRYFRDVIQNAGISETTQARQVLLNWTGTLRPNLINELRVNYNFGDFSRNFPRDLTTTDYTSRYLDIGGAGKGVSNAIGYGMARFFGGAAPRSSSEQSGGRSFDQIGFSQPQDVGKNTEHTYLLNDDLSWVRGRHTLKMGFSAQELMLNQGTLGFGSLAGGRYNFGREQTADRNCAASPYSGNITGCSGTVLGGDAFASFLLGMPSGLQVQTENLAKPYYYRWFALGAYIQDDWKILPNLTLNIGLRYQYQSPRWEKQNYQGQLNLTRLEPNPFARDFQGNPVIWNGPVFEFSGYDGRSRYMVDPQKLDFEPRFGFAWTPGFGWNRDGRIVIRGGYGLSHATLTGNDREPVPNIGTQTFGGYRALSYVLGPNNNSSPNITATCGLAICNNAALPMQFGYNNPILGGDPRIGTPPASGLIRPGDQADPDFSGARQDPRYGRIGFIGNPDFTTPMIQNYSLQVQYQFSGSTVLTVGYQGARGTHLMGPTYNINRRDPFIGDPSVKYPGYQSSGSAAAIYLLDPTDYSSVYHAGAADLERRFSRGLQFRFNYTFSKAIDNSSGGIKFPIPNNSFNNAAIGIRLTRNQQVDNPAAERSVSSTDTPHAVNLSLLYELPFGKDKRWMSGNRVLTPILGGWQVTSLGRWRSGYPMTVTMSGFNAIDSGIPGGEFRPDRILGVPLKNPNWNKSNWRTEPYVNPRAFAWPEPGKYGNAPRNFGELRSPWFSTLDSSLMKRFAPLKDERRIFEFRLEVFNLLNLSVLNMTNGTNVQVLSGNQNILLTNSSTGVPVADQANVRNRYANLRAEGVWDAIIAKAQGVNVDTAIASLSGPGPNGRGCPSNAAELQNRTGSNPFKGSLSPACVAREVSMPSNFYRFDQNAVRSRTIQLGLKFYF